MKRNFIWPAAHTVMHNIIYSVMMINEMHWLMSLRSITVFVTLEYIRST